MRCRKAQFVILAPAIFLAGLLPIHAQDTATESTPGTQASGSCLTHGEQPSGDEVSIEEVAFLGSLQMPISGQDQIATEIKQKTHGDVDGAVEEALERARTGWQNHGYFKVLVSGDSRALNGDRANKRISLFVDVDEGPQYHVSEITFKNNKAISNVEVLRALFPINAGDIFRREKIAKGLENLRKAYGQLGYINFTAIPGTQFDDDQKLVTLDVDMDEGKQFYVSKVEMLGLDDASRSELLNEFPLHPGQIYNRRLLERFLRKYSSRLPDCGCRDYQQQRLNERTGAVTLIFDFRACGVH